MLRPVSLADMHDLVFGDLVGMYTTDFGPLAVYAHGILLFAPTGMYAGEVEDARALPSTDEGLAFMVED